MKLLFVHQGFPGQFIHILRALNAQRGHQLVGLGIEQADNKLPKNVNYFRYRLSRGNEPNLHPWVQDIESKVIRGEACAKAATELKNKGFIPDLIYGHPGWGEVLFLRDVWPNAPLLTYQEFFYNPRGSDYDFDHELRSALDWSDCARIRMKTPNQLLTLEASNWSVTPTHFQRNTFPETWRDQISVIHDGVDTDKASPAKRPQTTTLPDGTALKPGDKIVTFVNRTLEPYRGCHTMIRAIPRLQQLEPDAKLVIVGKTSGVSYGAPCPKGEWKDLYLAEIEGQYDPSRVHFTGQIPHDEFISIMQLSQAHVYLTYPFVLSWSLLEAMSCGCPVVGSATEPVQEVIHDHQNGLLVDFFSPQAVAEAVAVLLSDRKLAKELGKAARSTILQHYQLKNCVQRQLALMDLVASRAIGSEPPSY